MKFKVDHARLSEVDLNLLVALDAIRTAGSVTKAANRLGVNQSSVSHQLGRLRELFGDELFVRSGTGMIPTPRGAEIAGIASEILRHIEASLLTRAGLLSRLDKSDRSTPSALERPTISRGWKSSARRGSKQSSALDEADAAST
jgi:molybdenum-dependent DNA-binding transcriptional regulator ModE